MKNDKELREHLVYLLQDGGAHANFDAAVKDMPPALRGQKPEGADHTPWELLEHLRITQWDILEFSRNAQHRSPDFPAGFFLMMRRPPRDKAWDKSVATFRAELKAMIDLINAPATDLLAKIPHGDGQTILREALLTADHNSYHIGQLVLVRKLLGGWTA